MPNKPYDNFFLANEIEDQYNSHLDLVQFCTVDNSLTGTAGMDYKVHVYKATDGTEKLTKGEGNTKTIEADFTEKVYKILLAQNRFSYFDEDAMTDPMVVTTGTRHAGVDLFNTQNTDIYAAFNDATLTLVTPALGFDAFVDAAAMLNLEELEGVTIFGFVNPAEMAKLRKALKDDLKYVESFAKQGYGKGKSTFGKRPRRTLQLHEKVYRRPWRPCFGHSRWPRRKAGHRGGGVYYDSDDRLGEEFHPHQLLLL